MQLYWQQRKKGQRLILTTDDGEQQEEVGGVRETKSGFDAFAKTFGYDPGRAEKGIATLDEAKAFVESFKPWEMFGSDDGITVEAQVRTDAT
jgi:hypothetical protein